MNLNEMAAVLTLLVSRLRESGSWCGETHIQKTAYFLQELFNVPLGFTFVLYRFGPFSFDLRYELTSLRTYGFLTLKPHLEYPPPFICTPICSRFWKHYPKILNQYEHSISLVTNFIGDRGVFELERLATALYVSRRSSADASTEYLVAELRRLKPHIERDAARESFAIVRQFVDSIHQEGNE